MSQDKPVLPCPFCGSLLKRIISLAKSFNPPREYIEWHHVERNSCYLLKHSVVLASTGDSLQREQEFLSQWNHRAIERQGSGKWDGKERRAIPSWDKIIADLRSVVASAQAQDAQTGEGE